MAAPSEPGTLTRKDEPGASRLVQAGSPQPGAGKDAATAPSAEMNAHGNLMNQFIQNLLRALSVWPV